MEQLSKKVVQSHCPLLVMEVHSNPPIPVSSWELTAPPSTVDWPEECVPAGPTVNQWTASSPRRTPACQCPVGWERCTGSCGSLPSAARHSSVAPDPTYLPPSGPPALTPSARTTDDLQERKTKNSFGWILVRSPAGLNDVTWRLVCWQAHPQFFMLQTQ